MRLKCYHKMKDMNQEEIATKNPKYWKTIINRFNKQVEELFRLRHLNEERENEIARLEKEIEKKNNLLKTYDNKVEELIVECHEVTERTGRWEYGDDSSSDEVSEIDFVEESEETKRIVVRDWGCYTPEYDFSGYREDFHIQDFNGTFYGKEYCEKSEGPVFWWIDIDGEEHEMADGAIISVKNKDGEVLYELSEKEKENLIIGDNQIWRGNND